jgi:hypothetical protein
MKPLFYLHLWWMLAEQTYKKSSRFINQCIHTSASLMKVIVRSKWGTKLPAGTAESCIVLGNGPSLKSSLNKDPNVFKSQPLVCVNSFSMSEEFVHLKPNYYVILDYSFWMSDGENVLQTLEAIKTKTSWELHLFVPRMASKSKRFTDLCAANNNIKLTYFNYTVFKGFDSIAHWFYNRNLAMPQSQNVLVASVFLSINMGFKKIMIVGADHTWHQDLFLDENNVLCTKHLHFYEKEEKTTYVPFKKGVHLNETFKVHEIFATWAKAFYGYIALEKYARYKNSKIVNASEVTFIDAFERVKLYN